MKTFLQSCLILTLSLPGIQAHAIPVASNVQNFTVNWSLDIGSNTLSAASNWTMSRHSEERMALDISITNTTLLTDTLTNADITSFGFGIDPVVRARLLVSGEVFDGVGTGKGSREAYPGGYQGISVCIFSSGCAGGSVQSALHAGASDHIRLLLTGNFSHGFPDLQYLPLKFQTSAGSFHPAGCVNCPPTTVPEPPLVMLLGLGLVLIALQHYRTRRA